jgi:hypothetical protein
MPGDGDILREIDIQQVHTCRILPELNSDID